MNVGESKDSKTKILFLKCPVSDRGPEHRPDLLLCFRTKTGTGRGQTVLPSSCDNDNQKWAQASLS